MPFCPECGKEVEAGKKFCYFCGEQLPGQSSTNAMIGSSGNIARHTNQKQVYSVLGADIASSRVVKKEFTWLDLDTDAVHGFKVFSILEIVGLILAIGIPLVLDGSMLSTIFGFTSLLSAPQNATGFFGLAEGLLVAIPVLIIFGLCLGIGASLKIRSAFKALSNVDRRFSTPKSLASSLVAGFGLAFVGTISFLLAIVTAFAAVKSSNAALIPTEGLLLIFALAMYTLAVIAIFVGDIGIALGVWRAGDRYESGLMKVSAILHLVPFLFFFAPILLFAGAHSAGSKSGSELLDQNPPLSTGIESDPANDDVSKIIQLKSLLDSGAITRQEFDAKKKAILHPGNSQQDSRPTRQNDSDELKKLKALYESGAINEDEYGERIKKALANMQS